MQEALDLPTQAELDNPFARIAPIPSDATSDAQNEANASEIATTAPICETSPIPFEQPCPVCEVPVDPDSVTVSCPTTDEEADIRAMLEESKRIVAAQDAVINAAMAIVEMKDELIESNAKVRELKREIEESQEQLIEATRQLKAIRNQPSSLETYAPGTPIDASYEVADPPESSEVPATIPINSGEQPAIEDESWRLTTLKTLNLPDSLRQALAENPGHPILTVGDIQAWIESGKILTDIPRVGQSKAEKIEQALESFWAKRNAAN